MWPNTRRVSGEWSHIWDHTWIPVNGCRGGGQCPSVVSCVADSQASRVASVAVIRSRARLLMVAAADMVATFHQRDALINCVLACWRWPESVGGSKQSGGRSPVGLVARGVASVGSWVECHTEEFT
jgi:hypothetical protein